HFEHLTREFLLLPQDFFQHRLLRVCNHVFRGGRRGWLLSERFWRQLVVQVGCDSFEGAQFLHQLTETDRDTELSFQQERSLSKRQRIQTQFHEGRVSVNRRDVLAGKLPQQRARFLKQTGLSRELRRSFRGYDLRAAQRLGLKQGRWGRRL